MLKSIGLENFKAFEKLKDIEFHPVTVFCGTNSSGKSTLIKSMLLLKQTLEKGQRGFAFNGAYVKLGLPKNLIKLRRYSCISAEIERKKFEEELGNS